MKNGSPGTPASFLARRLGLLFSSWRRFAAAGARGRPAFGQNSRDLAVRGEQPRGRLRPQPIAHRGKSVLTEGAGGVSAAHRLGHFLRANFEA
jgi:hypothetical protein